MRKYVVVLLKVAIPVAIIVWLLMSIEPEQLRHLEHQSKNWLRLSLAFATLLAITCVTFVRGICWSGPCTCGST